MFLSPPPLPLYVSVCLSPLYTSLSLSICTSNPLFFCLAHMRVVFQKFKSPAFFSRPKIATFSAILQHIKTCCHTLAGMLQYNVASGDTLQQWSLSGASSQVCSPGLSHTLRILLFAQKQGTERLFWIEIADQIYTRVPRGHTQNTGPSLRVATSIHSTTSLGPAASLVLATLHRLVDSLSSAPTLRSAVSWNGCHIFKGNVPGSHWSFTSALRVEILSQTLSVPLQNLSAHAHYVFLPGQWSSNSFWFFSSSLPIYVSVVCHST